MLQLDTLKAIRETVGAAWSAVGPLIGVLLGAYIANRNQRKQWLLDNKRQEYRELLSALTKAFHTVVEFRAYLVAIGSEEQRALANAERIALEVITDRLYVSKQVKEYRVLSAWQMAIERYNNSLDPVKFAADFEEIRRSIVDAALRDTGI